MAKAARRRTSSSGSPRRTSGTRSSRNAKLYEQIVESSAARMIAADRSLKITYANPASLETLKTLEHLLPCSVDDIVGQSIDIFHVDTERIGQIVNDTAQLPHTAEIRLGPEILKLTVTALLDSGGDYVGPMITWDVVTSRAQERMESEGKLAAISQTQAMIEFQLDGTIICANENFLNAMGYTIDQIRGKHHSMFVDDEYRKSDEYRDFWERLNRGEYFTGEYRRVGNHGKNVWIQGSYTPILDTTGKPIKVVKFATDVTERVMLQRAAEEQRERTERLIERVIESATQFAEGSNVIAASSASLSDSAQTQAATVEEMTATVEEMTRAVQSISHSAIEAKQQANETASLANDGGESVNEAVKAMRLIEKSSEQIDEIIQVISEIASQTNLLALNAAIEAARAGDHGLGFAVVADEVRKLAERSSEAAKEITQLIKESSRRVSEGAELSEKVGVSLSAIVDAADKTASGITHIAEQTETQAASTTETHSAIKSVSDTTESNAANAEQLAASAEQLGAQAVVLQKLVSEF